MKSNYEIKVIMSVDIIVEVEAETEEKAVEVTKKRFNDGKIVKKSTLKDLDSIEGAEIFTDFLPSD